MIFFLKRAIKDMADNTFLHIVTIITIALSILIASSIGLLFFNAGDVMSTWKKGIRIMAYVSPAAGEQGLLETRGAMEKMNGVGGVRFISKEEALADLKIQMKRQLSLIENLDRNPLPDAFEIQMIPTDQTWERIETLAAHIQSLPMIDDVEYGQAWLGRLSNIFSLFQFIGITMGVLFFMVTVFIISNTIRLALYSRREEIEIMRLVGATDAFIKIPSYFAGLIQGAVGGLLGLIALYISYLVISANIEKNFSFYVVDIHFLSGKVILWILLYSIFVGWLGCFLSLKQFLKN
ncbi:MAG: permease-like cell division protein FtsX [Proteobacteria bacterium]|nr:permease-like cell division protein FtsX [Pseudomonadota bacterium]